MQGGDPLFLPQTSVKIGVKSLLLTIQDQLTVYDYR